MPKRSLYKNKETKEGIFQLYDEKLNSLNIPFEEIDVNTSFGRTRVIKTGKEGGKKIVLFHGVNSGSPSALEPIKSLNTDYTIYAIDTIGQTTKSAETILDITDDSFAIWADEVLDLLKIEAANFIGISYGAFILQKLITYKPQKVAVSIFIVPSGLANESFGPTIKKIYWPLLKYLITKKDHHLKLFIKSFAPEGDEFMFKLSKHLAAGVNLDFRRPTILKSKEVKHFTKPVYLIVADNDVFFPGKKTVESAKRIFKNVQDVCFLENSKHLPHPKDHHKIESLIKQWIG